MVKPTVYPSIHFFRGCFRKCGVFCSYSQYSQAQEKMDTCRSQSSCARADQKTCARTGNKINVHAQIQKNHAHAQAQKPSHKIHVHLQAQENMRTYRPRNRCTCASQNSCARAGQKKTCARPGYKIHVQAQIQRNIAHSGHKVHVYAQAQKTMYTGPEISLRMQLAEPPEERELGTKRSGARVWH